MQKRNVLYIGNYLNRPGGNPPYMIGLGRYLEAEGYSMHYASSKTSKVLRLLHMCWAVISKSGWANYVLIDTYSTQNFYYAFFVSQICRTLKLKYIPILHGGNLKHRLEKNPGMCKKIFQNALINISPSRYLQEIFREEGYSNIRYIPNSILVQDFPYSFEPINTIKIFWLRSFTDIYNPEMAINVLKYLNRKGHDCELTMVGPITDLQKQSFQDLASSEGLKLNLPGKLEREEWYSLAKKCNIFINTSNFDNMPLSVIELMALGLPVVSTNPGGMPYLIKDGETGFVVEKNDHTAMAEKIIGLQKDQELARSISINARKKVEAFDWSQVSQKWTEVLA